MVCRAVFALLLFFALHPAWLRADQAQGDPRLEKLYATFMAPCCWRESLLVHHSPMADELREEIREWVARGRSDEEIKLALTSRYSTRILSLPEGSRGAWLAWTPLAAGLAGLVFVVIFIRRSVSGRILCAGSLS